jgi:hypothetical protein
VAESWTLSVMGVTTATGQISAAPPINSNRTTPTLDPARRTR